MERNLQTHFYFTGVYFLSSEIYMYIGFNKEIALA